MVSVEYAPLGIADDNVYPWQDFPDTPFVVRNDGMMGEDATPFFSRET